MKSVISDDWSLVDKTHIAVRDTAANIISAFNQPGCDIIDCDCINHVLRLALNDEVLEQQNVKNLKVKVSKVTMFAAHSNNFETELKKQQKQVMGKTSDSECLTVINDCKTRWNSTFYMFKRLVDLEQALVLTMRKFYDQIEVEFTAQDWSLMKKIVKVLKPFEQATKILSYSDASISMVIPIIFTIRLGLETRQKDEIGVITLKKNLLKNLQNRQGFLEDREEYYLATYLDPRFKWYFFTKHDTRQKCKTKILSKLKEKLSTSNDNLSESVASSTSSNESTNLNDSFDQKMKKIIMKQQSKVPKVDNESTMASDYLETYDQANVIDSKASSLHYWKKEHDSRHPIAILLSKLACYYLTPPPTSTDVERLFSTAGNILTDARNRLTPENLEKLLFIRQNLVFLNFQY